MDTRNFLAIDKETGEIVNVHTVPRGNACNCKCINCGGDLQARKGSIRKKHFKHISDAECNPETILHKLAKHIFSENNYCNLPEGLGIFHYHDVKEEVWLENQKPDIVLTGADRKIHVEIAVTSFIDYNKEQKIIAKGYNTIEIDLSKIDRHSSYEEVKTIVVDEVALKEIIHWYTRTEIIPYEKKEEANWLIWLGLAIVAGILWLCCRSPRKINKRVK